MLAVAAVALLSALAHGGDLLGALRSFHLAYLAPALALASLNYALRFLRWQYYLHRCGVAPAPHRSAAVFVSGLIMSVTPGKFGELFKSALLKESDGVPMALSAPIVVVERLADLGAVLALAALGAAQYSIGRTAVIAAGALIASVVLALSMSPRLAAKLGPRLARSRLLAGLTTAGDEHPSANGAPPPAPGVVSAPGERAGAIERAALVFAVLLRGRPLVVGIVLGILAWLAECVAFYLVLVGFGAGAFIPLAPLAATFIYALATLAGALSMLPGGLGATEASMAGLLIAFRVPAQTAAAATLVIRACTLWYAVVVGLGGYAFYRALIRARLRAAGGGPAAGVPPTDVRTASVGVPLAPGEEPDRG